MPFYRFQFRKQIQTKDQLYEEKGSFCFLNTKYRYSNNLFKN